MRNGSRGAVRSLLREPLVHFLALGTGLFLLFGFVSSPGEAGQSEIVVTSGQIDHIIEVFSKTRQRPPSPAELQGLIDDHVLEEVLYREAIAMGLDKGDTIIRRRLRQKMEFLVDDFAAREPTEEELLTFLNENPDRFRGEPKSSFEHIVFRHGSGDQAEQLLATLQAGGTVDVSTAGDPVPLPAVFDAAPEREIDARFGPLFTQQLSTLELGVWSGPIESPYGRHLIRMRDREAGRVPELSEIRGVVKREWLANRRRTAQETLFNQLRSQYVVTLQTGESADPTASSTEASE